MIFSYILLIEKTTFNATIIVAGINKTKSAVRTLLKKARTELIFVKKINVSFPSALTITRETDANKKVLESLSPVFKNPIITPSITSAQ